MRAATCIMNDDLEGAETGLGTGNSSFHKVLHKIPHKPILKADWGNSRRILADHICGR